MQVTACLVASRVLVTTAEAEAWGVGRKERRKKYSSYLISVVLLSVVSDGTI